MFFGASFRKVLAMFSASTKTNRETILKKSFSLCILPILTSSGVFFFLRKRKWTITYYLVVSLCLFSFKAKLINERVTEPRKKAKCPAWLGSDDYSLCEICDHNKMSSHRYQYVHVHSARKLGIYTEDLRLLLGPL